MNKKTAHLVILVMDVLSVGVLWIGYNDINQILQNLEQNLEVINFNSRAGFFVLGIACPAIHLFVIIDNSMPKLFTNRIYLVNMILIVSTVVLIAIAIATSSWLQLKAERSGYIYCRPASGLSALAKTLVYTKSAEICEELAAQKRKRP